MIYAITKDTLSRNNQMEYDAFYQFQKRLNRSYAALKHLAQSPSIESMPQWVSFQNTHICNLRCPHCQTHGTAEGRNHCNDKRLNMDVAMLKRVAEEVLPFADEFTLTLTGEPLATPDLENILHLLSPFGAKLDLITNGTLLTKEKLRLLIPILKRVRISVDGATARTFESIRLGANFGKVLNRIKLLTLTCNRFPKRFKPEISLSYTIMGSNITELPDILDIAVQVGVSLVKGDFIQIFYPDLADESVELYKPLYNAYHAEAMGKAKKLGINLILPLPFSGVKPSRTNRVNGENTIMPVLSSDVLKLSLEPQNWLDMKRLRRDAGDLLTGILDRQLLNVFDFRLHPLIYKLKAGFRLKPESGLFWILWMLAFSEVVVWVNRVVLKLMKLSRLIPSKTDSVVGLKDVFVKIQGKFDQELKNHRGLLEKISIKRQKRIRYCEYLHRCVYIFPSGEVSPCCVVGAPVLGNLRFGCMRDVWNGDAYNDFRNRFFSDNPVECCRGCKFIKYVEATFFLDQIPYRRPRPI